jgi:SHS family lactate transporter-like MFS transporter
MSRETGAEADRKIASAPRTPRGPGFAVAAGTLGWMLDAFDFFVVVFLLDALAAHFGVPKSSIVGSITLSLAIRPVGAALFGLLADRYGRRKPLMAVVAYFSLIEILSSLAPNFPLFLVLRGLFGIGIGGYWGVGASLAMESAPAERRGLISGILQAGYPAGYLLAAIAARLIMPAWGWRPMFWAGLILAAITLYITSRAPEPEAWKQHHLPSVSGLIRVAARHWPSFAYLVLLLTLMMFLSHGTQDLYPDFLKSAHHFTPNAAAYVAMIYNAGAVLGTILIGYGSERLGRRGGIITALLLCALVIPAWAFGTSLAVLILGAFLMQAGVQGAWGVIPAHLNELSPDAVRSLFPGLVYQLGGLLGSPANTIEYALRDRLGYAWALTAFEGFTIVALMVIFALGPERKGRSFLKEAPMHNEIPGPG